MKIKDSYILIFVFLLTLAFRLSFVLQSENFSSDLAYFNLRQIESIEKTGRPIFEDNLSHSGRTFLFPPLFNYIMAFFNILFGSLALKIIPELLISSLVFIVYLISREITSDKVAMFLSVLLVSFMPVLIEQTMNQLSVYSLILPIMFLMFFCLFKIDEKKYQYLYIVLLFFLSFLHPVALLFSLSLLFYMVVSSAESIWISKLRKEVIFFSIFLIILTQVVVYRNAFASHGINVLRFNTPQEILSDYFRNFSIINTMLTIGVFPLIFGIYGIISGVFKERRYAALLLSGLVLATTLLLAFKLIPFLTGLLLLGIPLTILASKGFEKVFTLVRITKFARFEDKIRYMSLIVVLLSLVTSFFTATDVMDNSISGEEIDSLVWIRDNTEEDSVVLASIEEGNLINAVANRKSIIDKDFLLISDAGERYRDVTFMFRSTSLVKALQLLREYKVDYVYFSDRAKTIYNLNSLAYTNEECLRLVKETGKTKIYRVRRC